VSRLLFRVVTLATRKAFPRPGRVGIDGRAGGGQAVRARDRTGLPIERFYFVSALALNSTA
jgi:hypothetical protein